ncbi:SRPBCC domain-containing protein [Microbispora corallina]|uniref:Activator of Hsp90 ATPase homologue 1/2-like C-terminal domain-containing protein n=1 Tax=Microbispora corallina TaxID=83302 RepID=A0ABQ4G628_9ACTN|nr:SRPBCC domain-containing protein [Microbispora corallina]GIH42529.1 hypothetical protein Mco01_55290 [Microbispora corallina]
MSHEFAIREEIELAATPEQVWEAIATGPGIDSWLMGHTEIEPGVGGAARMTMLGFTQTSTITAWEPGRRFAYSSAPNPQDDSYMAFEYLLEEREGGSTVLRMVHSGALGGDWAAEYDALTKGDRVYLRKLAAYLEHFPGLTSVHNVFAPGPQADGERTWAAVRDALGLTGPLTAGAPVRLRIEGLGPQDGVVEFADLPTAVGVRVDDGLYTFVHGYQDTVLVEHHNFAKDADHEGIERAWRSWLDRSFSAPATA